VARHLFLVSYPFVPTLTFSLCCVWRVLVRVLQRQVRKKELRDKVDVNFDGRVSFLEFLLYQYKASPKDLMDRQTPQTSTIPPEVAAAIAALAEVNRRVREYETEKARLEDIALNGSGIKSPKAKNELAQLVSGPLWEQINKALITAEAAVRIAQRKYGGGGVVGSDSGSAGAPRISGTMWWLDRSEQTTAHRQCSAVPAPDSNESNGACARHIRIPAAVNCFRLTPFFSFLLVRMSFFDFLCVFSELKTKKERYGPKAK
jgi:hypothetical protein